MKRIITILITIILLTGCGISDTKTEVADQIESSQESNIAPPQQIYKNIEYDINYGEEIIIRPNDIAKDLDGDKIHFTPTDILENNNIKITINSDMIKCKMQKEIGLDITETFEVYVTDGTYRTQIEININMKKVK